MSIWVPIDGHTRYALYGGSLSSVAGATVHSSANGLPTPQVAGACPESRGDGVLVCRFRLVSSCSRVRCPYIRLAGGVVKTGEGVKVAHGWPTAERTASRQQSSAREQGELRVPHCREPNFGTSSSGTGKSVVARALPSDTWASSRTQGAV